jgi:hypothetical protein
MQCSGRREKHQEKNRLRECVRRGVLACRIKQSERGEREKERERERERERDERNT